MPDTAEVTVTYTDCRDALAEISDLLADRLDALAAHLDHGGTDD